MHFINNLDYLLKEKGIRKSDLAKEINIAPSTISAWYEGKYEKVSLKVLKKVATFFNVTMDELVNDDLSLEYEHKLVYSSKDFTKEELVAINNFVNLMDSYKESFYSYDAFKDKDNILYIKCRTCGGTVLVNSKKFIKSISACAKCKRRKEKTYESSNLY